ncbi:probable APS3-AP-3 complex subunit, sigma3 subunit [Serendipita indica DSM 11827]|uniref:Probable APS3-AP-3 complex subunit, sigma3 subunit n=1 Tax=Serendipita indica (strain DSM 11827) TaxID=1109443 RepID=G4T6G5_SERID|nr:probable APS3-AP-3 complex subunit, sigma3 subunit [Serendipita indica DSM 11827]
MIHSVLIFNTSGTPRLIKFYTPLRSPELATVIPQKIFKLISSRPPGACNFLDVPDLDMTSQLNIASNDRICVVYRNYATLYFVFVIDGGESELGILDLIQVFVESLDKAFRNVCELDLVFHFDEVHAILAEIVQGGLVLETNVAEISQMVEEGFKARKASYAAANPLSLSGGVMGGSSRGGNSNVSSPLSSLQTPIGWLTERITGLNAR